MRLATPEVVPSIYDIPNHVQAKCFVAATTVLIEHSTNRPRVSCKVCHMQLPNQSFRYPWLANVMDIDYRAIALQ